MYEQYSSQEFEEKYTYSGNLGAFWTPKKTAFRLWAPTAGAVSIRLYRSGDPSPALQAFLDVVRAFKDAQAARPARAREDLR